MARGDPDADRVALEYLVRGILHHPDADPDEADLPAVRDAAVARTLRIRVALAAVGVGRVPDPAPGSEPPDPAALLDRVADAYPGWLFDPDPGNCRPARSLAAWPVAGGAWREAVAALAGSDPHPTGGGSGRVTAADGPSGVGPAADYPRLLELDLRVGEPDEGTAVVGAGEWAGDAPVVLAADADRRRSDGTYYTPPPVVDGVVERTLAPVLEGIRASPDPLDRALDCRVVDPAVGTGRFLVSAVECLARTAVEAANGDPDPGKVRRRVAERCVYGVDLDPLATELARATLWLRTGATDHAEHFRTGDALVGAAPGEDGDPGGPLADRALDWPAAFPDVVGATAADRPFDAAVGNPPYVRSRALPDPVREHLRDRYRTATGSFDLYVPFLERGAALGDRVGMVVSNKWTTADYAADLRSLLLAEWTPATVVDCAALDVFPGADVYPVVLACTPGESGAEGGLTIRTVDDPAAVAPVPATPGDPGVAARPTGPGGNVTNDDGPLRPDGRGAAVRVSAGMIDRVGGVVPVDLDPAFAPVVERVVSACDAWGDHVDTAEGIHTGNARDTLVVDDPVDDRCRPLADGRSIDRYRVEGSGEWVRYDPAVLGPDEYASLRDRSLFEAPKLLVRDISDRPVAAYDGDGLYALNSLYSARPTGSYPARYLLAVFNSAFVARFFGSVYGGTRVRDGYLRFKPTFLDRIPVPDPDPAALSAETRRRIAAHDATDPDDPRGIGSREAVTAALGSLAASLSATTAERAGVETDLDAHLGTYDPGPALGELPGTRPASGVAGSVLAETAADRAGLRVGRAGVAERDGDLVVRATARFKPADDGSDGVDSPVATDPDRWGYVETDPIPALRVAPGNRILRSLVRSFVPMAVDREVGFRARATGTIPPLARLRSLRLPDPDEVGAALREYRGALRRGAELDRRAVRTDGLIDRAVADLYGLDAAERSLLPPGPP